MPWLPLTPDTVLSPDTILSPLGWWSADTNGGYGVILQEVTGDVDDLRITGSIEPLGDDPTRRS